MNEIEITNMLISLSRSLKPEKGELEYALERYPALILDEIQKNGREYDMRRLEDTILKSRKYKTFPTVAELIEKLPQAQKQKPVSVKDVENAGATIRVTHASGRYTDYTVCGFGANLKDLINRFYKSDNIVKAVMYPAGVTLMSKTIWGDVEGKILYKIGEG